MKQFSHYWCFIALFAMLFTSCSKEDNTLMNDDSEKATLSFGAVLEDLASKSTAKQSESEAPDLPECSDADPAYVEIVLSRDGAAVVGSTEDPFRIDLVDGQIFTEEVPELELEPDTYTLDHFMVFSAGGDLLWVAPKGGVLADFLDITLPITIELGAGVKKYVDVPVLCYDNRDVREYGYLFFDFDTSEAIEFCIFGNYCPPDGRHYPARFSVDVWTWEDGQRGDQLHNDITNTVALNQYGDYAGTPVCVPLPDLAGQDEYYFEVTLLNSDAYPGTITERIVRRGVITDDEVRNFFDGENNLDYYHFREGEGCEDQDNPPIFEDPEEDAEMYKACLYPEGGTTAVGFAYFKVQGDDLQATVLASNLEANKQHLQHIHANADCDNAGAPILSLNNEDGSWPVATGEFGDIVYHRTFTGVNDQVAPLEEITVNIHGLTIDGTYNAGYVVACGEINKLLE